MNDFLPMENDIDDIFVTFFFVTGNGQNKSSALAMLGILRQCSGTFGERRRILRFPNSDHVRTCEFRDQEIINLNRGSM